MSGSSGAPWLDGILNRIFNRGTPLELGAGIDFKAPLLATKNTTTHVIEVTSAGGVGSGDVVGPEVTIDQYIAVFDGPTGKMIDGGGQTIAQVLAAADAAADAGDAVVVALIPAAGGVPANVTRAAAAAGSATSYSRTDHKHDAATAAPVSPVIDGANAEGASTSLARADHVHTVAAGVPVSPVLNGANAAGSAASVARSDHVHNVAVAVPVSPVINGANAAGSAASLARSDHVHSVAAAVAVALTHGGASAEGAAASVARSDHTHALPALGGGVELNGGIVQVATTLPARGTENVTIDVYPSTQAQGTVATGASVNFDFAVATGKRYEITASGYVDDGTGTGACLFTKALYAVGHQTGGAAVLITSSVVHDNAGAGFTFTVTANGTNIRFTLSNTSGTTRSYNVLIGAITADKP